jgi:predicted negative regulator of RcsB-dependent stress response
MATANHYKVTRKALREPDEFQTLTTQAVDWFRANQSLAVTVASGAVAIAAVILGLEWYSQRQAEDAAVHLQGAQAVFQAKRYAEAAAEFAAVTTAHPRTPSGHIAALYRAHALAEQPDAAAAATAYSEYLASTPATDYLRQEALVGLAHASEATQKTDAAQDAYRQAADIVGPFRSQAQLGLARLEEAAGHTEQAKTLYTEALKAPDLDAETRQSLAARFPDAVERKPAVPPAGADTPPADDDAAPTDE